MKLTLSRRAVALTGAALAVTSLPLLTMTTSANADETPAPTTTYTKTLKYACDVSAPLGDTVLVFDDVPVTAKVTFALPRIEAKLQDIKPTDVKIDLRLPELLRGASVAQYGAVAASGESTNTKVSLSQNNDVHSVRYYRIPKLAAEKAAIPQTEGEPWIIPATGVTPTIVAPGGDSTSTQIGGPLQFDIDSTLYDKEGVETSVPISCDAVGSRAIATLKIGEVPTMSAVVKPSVVKARKAGAVVQVKIGASSRVESRVLVYKEGGKIGNFNDIIAATDLESTDNSNATIKLPAFGKRGKRTLTVVYEGDLKINAKAVKATFTVK